LIIDNKNNKNEILVLVNGFFISFLLGNRLFFYVVLLVG